MNKKSFSVRETSDSPAKTKVDYEALMRKNEENLNGYVARGNLAPSFQPLEVSPGVRS
jgi:hypothetical protein